MSREPLQFLASSPRGLADLLARELAAFGAENVRERSAGVVFSGDLKTAYRACVGSRIANRVFLELGRFEVQNAEEFYTAARSIDWAEHLGPGATLACDFSGHHPAITHTHFGALKLKDAIVDSIRDCTGQRPDVSPDRPSVRVHAHAHRNTITISIDLSGESLHRRGYRGSAGEAPLKENVAAGILMRAGWPDLVASGAPFLDPMCGSGTLVIEAALMAINRSPGVDRDYFGFLGWRRHDPELWREVLQEAKARESTPASLAIIRGCDRDSTAIRNARANAERAKVAHLVQWEVQALSEAVPPPVVSTRTLSAHVSSAEAVRTEAVRTEAVPAEVATSETALGLPTPPAAGLLCVNPPYGVRMEDHATALAIHRELGRVLRERFQGWYAAVLIGAPELGMELGLRAYRTHTLWNGALECRLLRLKIDTQSVREPGRLARPDAAIRESPGAKMFANRLAKNLKRLKTWVDREGVSCYRAYDADMPEYAFAIDVYGALEPDQVWLYVQEYAAPAEIELEAVRRRRNEAFSVLSEVTGVPGERIRVRTRRRSKGGEQYRKLDEQGDFHLVAEGGLKFRVNFADYLDTGLFLDHRITRARLREAASGKRFLNLFAYTGTATVYAASGSALSTATVDMSRTYLDWAQRNLTLNGLTGSQHVFIQSDCREWLQDSARRRERYDLIFLDPPTFSNSKRMEGVLDVERDHPVLIDACARMLAPGGLIVFSTNAQRFKLEESLAGRYEIRDISAATLPRDFERNPRIHRCFEIRAVQPGGRGPLQPASAYGNVER